MMWELLVFAGVSTLLGELLAWLDRVEARAGGRS